MRDLETIRRVNSAEGVGAKLGPINGDPVAISTYADDARYVVRESLDFARGPSAEPLINYIAEAVDAAIAGEAA